MRRTRTIGLIAIAMLAVASAVPERALPQVGSSFDVRNSGFAPASPRIDTRSILMSPSSSFSTASQQAWPGSSFCPGAPGFGYGPFLSPFDVRISGYWFSPATRWYGSGSYWPSFGYGSYWPAAGWGAWHPWPASRSQCGFGSSFYWGYGTGFGYGGNHWGYGYRGYNRFGGFGGGYPGYPTGSEWSNSGWGNSGWGPGTYSGPRGTNGALGLDKGSGYLPPSVREAKGFRVIESRSTTGGADLRRTEPSRLDRWFEEFEADAGGARSATPTSRDPIGDAQARGRAYERSSRESISEVIARARAATRGAAATPERTRAEPPARTAAPARMPVRTTPSTRAGSKPKITPASAARSAPKRTPRAAPKSKPRVAPKSSRRSTGKSPQ